MSEAVPRLHVLLGTEPEYIDQHSGQKHTGEDQDRSGNEKTKCVWKGRKDSCNHTCGAWVQVIFQTGRDLTYVIKVGLAAKQEHFVAHRGRLLHTFS